MNFKMVLSIAAMVIIGTLNLWGQKPTEEDPYLLWQTTDPLGYSGFVIHPNGNIIANRNAEIFELDGNTGQVIKTFPVFVGIDIDAMDVTKDGKILGAGYGNIILYDLANDTVIGGVSETNSKFAFFPDSKRFLARTTDGFGSNLMIYNLETKEKTVFGVNYAVWAVATSPDGKYFATGGNGKEQVGIEEKEYTYLTLWDAQTLKPIKQLGKFEGNSEVTSINFSPDSKYVGFRYDYLVINLYNVENFELIKSYENVGAFGLFSKNLIGVFMTPGLVIKDFMSNKDLFETTNTSGGSHYYIKYNKINNSLIYGGGILRALDLNKILTSVPELPEKNNLTVQYKKGFLLLTNLNLISSQIKLTISDITGKVIRKLDSPVANSELRIPLILPYGTYLLHIQNGNKEYSSKFLVTE